MCVCVSVSVCVASVVQQLFGCCTLCVIRPSLFTTQQVSKCLFHFKGFLCFMWQGVYISPQTIFAQGGSIHILFCSPSHSTVVTFVQGSGFPRIPQTADCLCVSLSSHLHVSFFLRLPPSGWQMDGNIWHVSHLCQRAGPAGRASDQSTSLLCLRASHCGFVSLPGAELWPGQHIMPGQSPFPGELWHVAQQHKVFLEGF